MESQGDIFCDKLIAQLTLVLCLILTSPCLSYTSCAEKVEKIIEIVRTVKRTPPPFQKTTTGLKRILSKLKSNGGEGKIEFVSGHGYLIRITSPPSTSFMGSAFQRVFSYLEKHNIPVYLTKGATSYVPILRDPIMVISHPLGRSNTSTFHELQHVKDWVTEPEKFLATLSTPSDELIDAIDRAKHWDKLSNHDRHQIRVYMDYMYSELEVRARRASTDSLATAAGIMDIFFNRKFPVEMIATFAVDQISAAYQHVKLAGYAFKLRQKPLSVAAFHGSMSLAHMSLLAASMMTVNGGTQLILHGAVFVVEEFEDDELPTGTYFREGAPSRK